MTNLINTPEDITGAGWSVVGAGISANANVAEAPDGTMTADSLVVDNAGGNTIGGLNYTFGIQADTQYCAACFMKTLNNNELAIRSQSFTTPPNTQSYYENDPALVASMAPQFDDAGVEEFPNGWMRAYLTMTFGNVDLAGAIRWYLASVNNISVPRDGSIGILLWGMTFELGATPSPYVSEAGITISNKNRNIMAVTRRRSDEMIVRPRMPKPRNTLRGKFE